MQNCLHNCFSTWLKAIFTEGNVSCETQDEQKNAEISGDKQKAAWCGYVYHLCWHIITWYWRIMKVQAKQKYVWKSCFIFIMLSYCWWQRQITYLIRNPDYTWLSSLLLAATKYFSFEQMFRKWTWIMSNFVNFVWFCANNKWYKYSSGTAVRKVPIEVPKHAQLFNLAIRGSSKCLILAATPGVPIVWLMIR